MNSKFSALLYKYQNPVPIAAESFYESKNPRKISTKNFRGPFLAFWEFKKFIFYMKNSKFKNIFDIARLSLNLAFTNLVKFDLWKNLKPEEKTTMLKEEFECYIFGSFKLFRTFSHEKPVNKSL